MPLGTIRHLTSVQKDPEPQKRSMETPKKRLPPEKNMENQFRSQKNHNVSFNDDLKRPLNKSKVKEEMEIQIQTDKFVFLNILL